ncbi:uncharacterized protein LOC135389139 [Ornithodoros turicata]|uniref:uncharacterized protein LOC135389139 n=1 Tax=Ornithodoros turicata TaxID=34597 RepID=UPI00313A340A
MVKRCYIHGCTSVDSGEDTKLFPFPDSAAKRKLWLNKIVGRRSPTKSPTDNDCVCSLHFRSECFTESKRGIELKDDAFPTERLLPVPGPLWRFTALEDVPSDSYSCLVCNGNIKHMYELLKEVHIHRENRCLVCGHCRDIFDSYSKYMAHVTELGVAKPFVPSRNPGPAKDVPVQFECAECCALFETNIARNVHVSMTHNLKHTMEFARREEREREKAARPKKGRCRKILADDFEETEVTLRRSSRTRKRKVLADRNGKSARTKKCSARHKGRAINVKTRIEKLERATQDAMERLHKIMKQTPTKQKVCNRAESLTNERIEEADEKTIEGIGEQENSTERHHPVHWYTAQPFSCGFCCREFVSQRNLDRHCILKHPDRDVALELMCEVDSSYNLNTGDFCKACLRKNLCLEILQELLDDTDSTDCSNTKVAIIASSENCDDLVCSE